METNKILGYVLLFAGVLLIVGSLWQTYNILTGTITAPQVFKKSVSLQANQQVSTTDVQGQMQNALIKVLPIGAIDNSINIGIWLLLMWVLIYGGGKLADIGVKLLK